MYVPPHLRNGASATQGELPPRFGQPSQGWSTGQSRGAWNKPLPKGGRGQYVLPSMRPQQPIKPDWSKEPTLSGEAPTDTNTKSKIVVTGSWAKQSKLTDIIKAKPLDTGTVPLPVPVQVATPPLVIVEEPVHSEDDRDTQLSVNSQNSYDELENQVKWEQEQRINWDEMEWRLECRYEIHFSNFEHFKRNWFLQTYGDEFNQNLVYEYNLEQFRADAKDYFNYLDQEYGTTEQAKERYHRYPKRGWYWASKGYWSDLSYVQTF